MKQIHVRSRHVQAALSEGEYDFFKRAAKRQGLTLQEAVKRAVKHWTFTEGGEPDPFDALIGKFSGPTDLSTTVDDIYDED